MNRLQHHPEQNTNDADFTLSLDEDLSRINASIVHVNADTAMQPIEVEMAQISPYGADEDMDRRLLAPTPPLFLSQCILGMETFISPTLQEAASVCDVPMSTTTFQTDHRHVTPMPFGGMSPIPPLNILPICSSLKDESNDCAAITANNTVSTNEDVERVNSNAANAFVESIHRTSSTPHHIEYYQSTLFPILIHRMVSETSDELGQSSMIYWTESGDGFWIDQKDPMLSSVIGKYFKHKHYQSLRRQLNSYGFHKIQLGKMKGCWTCPKFRRDCSITTLKSLCKVVVRRRKFHSTCKAPRVDSKSKVTIGTIGGRSDKSIKKVAKKEEVTLVEANSSLSCKIATAERFKCEHSIGTAIQAEALANQSEAQYKIRRFSGDRRTGISFVEATGDEINACIALTNAELLLAKDPFLLDPTPDRSTKIPTIYDDTSHDALTALATVASFLPIASTPLYTPIAKDPDVIKPVPFHQPPTPMKAAPPPAVKMTILSDAANYFYPTPIKLPAANTDWDHAFWSDSMDRCFDDTISTYSVESLSSPMNLIVPSNDRSAFAPVVVPSVDQMVAEFCATFE